MSRSADRHDGNRRAEMLRSDLGRLGIGVVPPPVHVAPLASTSAALGAAYVLEGSLLGGRVIAARARAALGDDVPTEFLTGAGADVALRWSVMRAELDAAVATAADVDRATGAAVDAFDLVTEALLR